MNCGLYVMCVTSRPGPGSLNAILCGENSGVLEVLEAGKSARGAYSECWRWHKIILILAPCHHLRLHRGNKWHFADLNHRDFEVYLL